MHCVGCYSFIEDRNTSKKLSCDEIKKILDGLKQVGVQKIVISGGEPFIRNDLEEICKYAKEVCRFEFLTIITNGTMNIERYYPVLRYINQLNISMMDTVKKLILFVTKESCQKFWIRLGV